MAIKKSSAQTPERASLGFTQREIARKRRLRRIFREHNKPLEGLNDSLKLFEENKREKRNNIDWLDHSSYAPHQLFEGYNARTRRENLRRENKRQNDSSVFDISPLYAPRIQFNNELFQNVVNQAISILRHHEVTFLGTVYDEDGEKIWNTEFTPGFRKEIDFQNYISNLGEKYDITNWTYTGEIKYQKPEFKLVNRSRFGHGSLFFSIEEYESENVFIPTSDNCFYKCVQKVYPEIKYEDFNSWFFQSSNVQKGQMTLALINKFNQHFNTSITYFNENDRHLYPKVYSKTTPDKIIFLHDKHYCLINKNNKARNIEELKTNFKKTWKKLMKDVLKQDNSKLQLETQKRIQLMFMI